MGQDSVIGIATCNGLDDPGIKSQWGARFSVPIQTNPGTHPASHTMGTGLFCGVKQAMHGANHPPTSSAEVKERVELYLMACSRVNFTLTMGYSDIWNYHDLCTTPNKILVSLKKIWSWGNDL
jgi:hypothetical protein